MTCRPFALLFAAGLVTGCNCGERVTRGGGELSARPASIDFGSAAVPRHVQRSVSLVNVGSAPLQLEALTIDGPDAAAFTILHRLTDLPELRAGESIEVELDWVPARSGVHIARLLVESDAVTNPELAIPLSGFGAEVSDTDAGVPDAGAPDAGTPDAGAPDAGVPDAAFELPSFDGGGPCGNVDVIDRVLLPASAGVVRDLITTVAADNVLGLGWLEHDPYDGGEVVARLGFARATLVGNLLAPPRVIPTAAPLLGSEIDVELAWSGQQFAVAYRQGLDGGQSVGFQRLDATGAPIGGSALTTPRYGAYFTAGLGVAWNPASREWGLASQGMVIVGSFDTPRSELRRISEAGAYVGSPALRLNSELPIAGSNPLSIVDGAFSLGTITGVAQGVFMNSVTLSRLDPTTSAVTEHTPYTGWQLCCSVGQAIGPSTAAVLHGRLDGSDYSGQLGLVDHSGAAVLPVARTLPMMNTGSVSSGIAWNGSEYVAVYETYRRDAGYDVVEERYDETAAQTRPPRFLTCDGAAGHPSLAYEHGVHFVTYSHGGEQRLVLFK